MPSYLVIKESIQGIEKKSIETQEEQLFQMLQVYLRHFPVLNGYLFRYSPIGYFAEGIILVDSNGLKQIGDIRDDVRTLPVIYPAIYERKSKYFYGLDYFKRTTRKYIIPEKVNSVIVVPILYQSLVIGYICSNQIKKNTTIDEKLLDSFTEFGKIAGSFIFQSEKTVETSLLSRRELEVMKRISWGESIKEMADKMKITEPTVKQYIKIAIKKLGAKNRTHAVSELFRMGIIS